MHDTGIPNLQLNDFHSLQTRAGRHPISTCTSAHVQAAAIALVWNIAGMRDIAPAPAQHAESVLIQRERNYDRDAEAACAVEDAIVQ